MVVSGTFFVREKNRITGYTSVVLLMKNVVPEAVPRLPQDKHLSEKFLPASRDRKSEASFPLEWLPVP